MVALGKLVDFFSISTESGKALKALFESLFQPLADGAPGILSKIERLMLGMVIGALKIGIAVKAAAAAFDFDLGPFEAWPDLGKVGEYVAYAVVGAFAAMAAVVAAAAYPYYSVIDAIMQLKTGWDAGKAAMDDFVTKVGIVWGRLNFGQIASDLIDGFVKGIKEGISRAVAAVEEMASAAAKAAKNKLKIFSPSRVFADIGDNVAQGFAGGVEDGTPDAAAAVRSLVEPPDLPALSASSGSGATVTFAAGSIVIQAADGSEAGDLFVARVTELLEGLGMQVGAPA